MTVYLRRTTMTCPAPGECARNQQAGQVVTVATPPVPRPDRDVAAFLESEERVFACYARADRTVTAQNKAYHIALKQLRKPLTEEVNDALLEWYDEKDKAVTARIRANKVMDFEGVLRGAVMLKRFALYFTTQVSELYQEQ